LASGAVVSSSSARRRPDGITLLSCVMAVMAVSGLVCLLFPLVPGVVQLLHADWLATPTFTVIMLASAGAAALSAVGLWRLRHWSVWSYVAWCASMATGTVWFRSFGTVEEARTANMIAGGIVSALYLLACPYIVRNTRALPTAE